MKSIQIRCLSSPYLDNFYAVCLADAFGDKSLLPVLQLFKTKVVVTFSRSFWKMYIWNRMQELFGSGKNDWHQIKSSFHCSSVTLSVSCFVSMKYFPFKMIDDAFLFVKKICKEVNISEIVSHKLLWFIYIKGKVLLFAVAIKKKFLPQAGKKL